MDLLVEFLTQKYFDVGHLVYKSPKWMERGPTLISSSSSEVRSLDISLCYL